MTGETNPIETFRQPDTDDAHLFAATSDIPLGAVPATFWQGIGADEAAVYRPYHRGLAVHELLRRHVRPPAPLWKVASMLGGGRWTEAVELERVAELGGELPIVTPAGGTTLVVRGPTSPNPAVPGPAAYLAIDRDVEVAELLNALRGDRIPAGEARVVGIAVSPDRPVATAGPAGIDSEAE